MTRVLVVFVFVPTEADGPRVRRRFDLLFDEDSSSVLLAHGKLSASLRVRLLR